ncbi:hypothetical protein GMA12_06630 [Kocuria sediminis]|uniref:Uncharacterized protein n=1 Tax=Kocuria sediminis TaxID=1038857 RepID=A0A6N8GI58_9MICC|nr:hypothetical protein [Kocuria sediminis]MUN62816.1 hypothetical protein [Kocuria sediminis]
MNSAGSTAPGTPRPPRLPRWLVVLASLGVVVVLGGALLVLLNPPEASFGWFAYAPLSDGTFPAVAWVTPQAAAGWTGVAAGLAVLAFCAGWLAGRRRPVPPR